MNIEELENKLIKKGIPDDAYSLKGGLPNEAYCLGQEDGKWLVYYSERGTRTSLKEFFDEDAACKELAKRLGVA